MSITRWFFQLFWIGVCAVALLWQSHYLSFGSPAPSLWLTGFVGAATVFGYNFAGPPRLRWPARALGWAGAYCFFQLNLAQQLAVVLPALIWLLYYDRYHPGQGTGLRRYPALKPIAIALAWAGVTVLLPLPPQQWTGAGPLFVGRAAFIFALALAYDLCDQPVDQKKGLDTLVLALGPRRSQRLIYAALLLASGCAGLELLRGVSSGATTVALIFSLILSGSVIPSITERLNWLGWRKILIDSLMLLQFVFVCLSLK